MPALPSFRRVCSLAAALLGAAAANAQTQNPGVMEHVAEDIAAAAPGDVIGTSIGITVADTAASLEFYRDLLGFEIGPERHADARELRVHGLSAGGLLQTTAGIPGTSVSVLLSESRCL